MNLVAMYAVTSTSARIRAAMGRVRHA